MACRWTMVIHKAGNKAGNKAGSKAGNKAGARQETRLGTSAFESKWRAGAKW